MTVGNKEIFARNLGFYMERKGVDRNKLCSDLNFKYTTVRDWLKGITYPRIDKIEILANYFKIEKSDLIEDKHSSSLSQGEDISSTLQKITTTSSRLEHKRQLNVLDYAETQLEQQNTVEYSKDIVVELFSYNYYDHAASAGTGQYLNDVQVETIELPVDYDADFVIPVYGDSMEPKYHSGDYVFVKLSINLSDGDIGVFEYYGDAYIKQLLINAEGAFLHSLNSKYDDIPIDADSDFRIIGEVVGSYSENHS
ncbi:Phage transcriptional repressor [Streptococcus dysgalactiae subsp. equisimilis]|uniref:Phage transcriptional repressor n=2 Tax=Streptococcus dysgalactiae TaxID=1334 RepID=A0A9X8XF38_STREQ|nr:Phage transcriptional repressor [Streptococcus dysgalactiae subsp. equisimilis]VEF04395.1 Phage transcriptional repressor [Streptococcus dysgalactiae subsp. equisimilis]